MARCLFLIPLAPLAGFLVNVFGGRRLSRRAAGLLACTAMVVSFLVSALTVTVLLALPPTMRTLSQTLYTWLASGDLQVGLTLRVDPLASVMILVVSGIGLLIHVYSLAYMEAERPSEYARYFSYMNLFASFMLILVLAGNLLVMFVGWEGVGLCSYLLIGFWYQKRAASDAGNKAFIVNRIGDWGFLIGMLLVFVRFGTFDFTRLASLIQPLPVETSFGVLSLIALLLFVGATGKSAQLPLHVWLPDAMEGPTPVSALIHAATMVTAGVYMIGRLAVLFAHAPHTRAMVALVGAATALFAATIGLAQMDIKRVLAYSTVSQLGYMFLAMGVGAFAAGIFHLFTHAFFKALLFLGSGAVIHALGGEQDLRRMGGLRQPMPITYWTFLIAALAISGVPLFSGFFSKDEILFRAYSSPGGSVVLWAVGIVTALLTAFYMFRLVFLTFHGTYRGPRESPAGAHAAVPLAAALHAAPAVGAAVAPHGVHPHDAPQAMSVPLVLLAVGAILAGYIGVPHVLGGSNWIERYLEPSFTARAVVSWAGGDSAGQAAGEHQAAGPQGLRNLLAGEQAPTGRPGQMASTVEVNLMATSVLVAILGIALAYVMYVRRPDAPDRAVAAAGPIYRLLWRKYYVDELYHHLIVEPIVVISDRLLWRTVDARVIDGAVNGAGSVVAASSRGLRLLQTGYVRAYVVAVLVGVVLILGYYLFLFP